MKMNFVLISFVALVVIWAYMPVLGHVPKDDQVTYLTGVAKKHDLFSLTIGSYAFNRDQGADNILLFRPGLYVLLGLEQYLFGYQFPLWQGMGILLHLWVCWSLGALLWAIRPGRQVILLTAFFALTPVHVGMVNWPNVHAYMLFAALVLIVLRYLYTMGSSVLEQRVTVKRVAGWMLLASLCYEGGIVFSLVIGLYLWFALRKEERTAALWMLVPPAVSASLNVADLVFVHPLMNAQTHVALGRVLSLDTLSNFLQTLKWLLMGGIYVSASDMLEIHRTVLLPSVFSWAWPFTKFSPYVVRGSLLVAVCLGIILIGWNRGFWKRQRRFSLLLLGMALSYVVLLVAGRINARGSDWGASLCPYYFYIFWTLCSAFLYSLVDLERIKTYPYFRPLSWLVLAVFAVMIVTNTESVWRMNQITAKTHAASQRLLSSLVKFIDEHKRESDFSFYIDEMCPGNRPDFLDQETDCNFARYYWPQYFRQSFPKYVLPCSAFGTLSRGR